jgi:DNA-binding FadR family transcriptional regulator
MARIASGEYAVGEKLPAETELARQFGFSRPSVREALRALQFGGYVDSVRGSGTRVVSRTGTGGASTRAAPITATGVLHLYEARLVVEPRVAAIAARDPHLEHLERAEGLVTGMALVVDEPTLHGATDLLVHRVIAQVCRNVFLRHSLLELLDAATSDQLASVRTRAWGDHDLSHTWLDQQRQVVRAIRARDEQAAAEASWAHLASSARHALTVIAGDPALDQQAIDRLVAVLDAGPLVAITRAPPKS